MGSTRVRIMIISLFLLFIASLAKRRPAPNTIGRLRSAADDVAHHVGYELSDAEVDEDSSDSDPSDAEDEDDDDGSLYDICSEKSLGKRILTLGESLPTVVEVQSTLASRVDTMAAKAKQMMREIKGSHSSEFECAVVKGTRPDDEPAKEKWVARLVETISTFPMATAARSSNTNTDYYRMMLHKLWSRMVEKDWRTVAKAVYIFHRSAIALDPELHREFLMRYNTLRKSVHKTGLLYFSNVR